MKKIILFLMIAISISAQVNDPYAILKKVENEFAKIEDYQVNIKIIVDVDFLKVPESYAKIYYKKPDKYKMESDGFALLPKQGMNLSPAKLLGGNYSAIYVNKEVLDNDSTHVIKVIPMGESTDVVLSTLWIDPARNVIRKIETTTKTTGTVVIELHYSDTSFITLPSEVTFLFNLSNVKIPIMPGVESDENQSIKKKSKKLIGTVTVKYDNYIVNEGLDDSIFNEDVNNK
ncbi:MAG: hypothetical protein KAQ90_07330 [Melioribacteraceae bacterium]|nr:hypothetical protein [Melioribacteraceae bacterium]